MGGLLAVRALTRVILTQVRPHVRFYVLPLQLHPCIRPGGMRRQFLCETDWQACGPFLTLAGLRILRVLRMGASRTTNSSVCAIPSLTVVSAS